MTKKQKFRKDYAKELLRIAESDLHVAIVLSGVKQVRPETAVFHIQQAIEKSIKAVTCHFEIAILMVHDIGSLLGELPKDKLPPYDYDLTRFNDFAGILRYEEGKAELSKEDVDQAIDVGRQVILWAKNELQ